MIRTVGSALLLLSPVSGFAVASEFATLTSLYLGLDKVRASMDNPLNIGAELLNVWERVVPIKGLPCLLDPP